MRKVVLLAVLGILAGCATVEDAVEIKYTPTSAAPVANAQPVALTVVDARTADRSRISTKINGYGMEMAAIRSAQDVTEVVRQAAAKEFQERGFNIEVSGLNIKLTVNRFYNQYATGFFAGTADGAVELSVAVTDAVGAKLYESSYSGTSKMSISLANGSNAAESVSNALNDAMHRMFADPAFIQVLTRARPGSAPTS